jgi:hypothetical protein
MECRVHQRQDRPLPNTSVGSICRLTTSASLAIPTAISFALLAQLILVEAGRAQFAAHITSSGSLAGVPVSAAVSFALFPQPVLVFTGTSQFLALAAPTAAVIYSHPARTNLNRLRKGRCRNYKQRRCRDHESKVSHHYLSVKCQGNARLSGKCLPPDGRSLASGKTGNFFSGTEFSYVCECWRG